MSSNGIKIFVLLMAISLRCTTKDTQNLNHIISNDYVDSLVADKSLELINTKPFQVQEDTAYYPDTITLLCLENIYDRAKWEFYLYFFDKDFEGMSEKLFDPTYGVSVRYRRDTVVFSSGLYEQSQGMLKKVRPSNHSPMFNCYFSGDTHEFIGYNFGINEDIVTDIYTDSVKINREKKMIQVLDSIPTLPAFLKYLNRHSGSR